MIRIRAPAANSISIETACLGRRRQWLPVWSNGDGRKTDFAILPLQRPRLQSEDARARLPSPNRYLIAVNIMSSANLDNAAPRRQTLLHDPKLLGSGPPPSPLWTGQNRNCRYVCSSACKLMSKSSHARSQSGKAALTGGLPTSALSVNNSLTEWRCPQDSGECQAETPMMAAPVFVRSQNGRAAHSRPSF